jgi:hypothetical protein
LRDPARFARIGTNVFYMRGFPPNLAVRQTGHAACGWGRRTNLRSGEYAMKFKFGIRQALVSSAIFAGILTALVFFDAGVRDRFSEVVSSGGASSLTARVSYLGDAMFDAARHQSLENAPMVVFATAGALLFLFMVRT